MGQPGVANPQSADGRFDPSIGITWALPRADFQLDLPQFVSDIAIPIKLPTGPNPPTDKREIVTERQANVIATSNKRILGQLVCPLISLDAHMGWAPTK